MKENTVLYILVFIIFCIVLIFYHFKLYQKKSHIIAINLFVAFGSIFTLYVIYLQINAKKEEVKRENNIFFQTLLKNLFDNTLDFFVDHPEMDYLFNNMYYNIPIPQGTKRDEPLEKKICFKIFYETCIFIFYYTTYKNNENYYYLTYVQYNFVTKLYKKFLNSSIFKENLIFFLQNHAGPPYIDFMSKEFNINVVQLTKEQIDYLEKIKD